LYPAYQHGRSVEVRITLAQLAGSDLAHVNPTTGFIGEPVYQTVPPGLARPDIRINYQRQSSEFTDDTPARLNFTFTSLITPLSRVGTILDFVLIGSQ
jgi:hypothetical protein